MAKIYWAGQSCFQVSVSNSRDHSADIVIDPFNESVGLKFPNLSADIALVSNTESGKNVPDLKGTPFIVSGPGEYEVKGVFINGIPSFTEDDQKKSNNTIYLFEAEGIKFCHLGNLNQKQLTDDQLEKIDSVDVLMIPVGGNDTIDSSSAQKIIGQIDPKIVIPMHYALPKLKTDLDDVSKFLKTMGKNEITPVDKFTVKDSTLPKEGAMEIIVLQP